MRNSIFIIISLLILSCKSKLSSEESLYYSDFTKYMNEIHEVKLETYDTHSFFVFSMSGCDPCVKRSLTTLFQEDINNLTLILVGEIENEDYLEIFKKIKSKYPFFIDREKNIYSFQTNLYKPLLVKIKEKQPIKYNNVSDSEIAHLKSLVAND